MSSKSSLQKPKMSVLSTIALPFPDCREDPPVSFIILR